MSKKLTKKEQFEKKVREQMQNGFEWSSESWSITKIVDAYDKGILIDPDYQRGKVWDTPKNKALIDTIFRYGGNKIPRLTFRRLDNNTDEIIDGKQRLLSAIIPFVNDEFTMSGVYNPELKGYTLSDIENEYPTIYGAFMGNSLPVQVATDMSYDDAITYFIQINSSGVNMRCGEQIHAMQGTPLIKTINELISHDVWNKVQRQSRFNNHECTSKMLLFARDKKDFTDTLKVYNKNQLLNELEVYRASEVPKSAIVSVKETFNFLNKIFNRHDFKVTITEFYSIFVYTNLNLDALNSSTFGKFLCGLYYHIHNNLDGIFRVIKNKNHDAGFKYTAQYYQWYNDVLNSMYAKFIKGDDWNDIKRLSIKE